MPSEHCFFSPLLCLIFYSPHLSSFSLKTLGRDNNDEKHRAYVK